MIEINCEVFETCADALAAESRGPLSGTSKRVAIQKGDLIMVVPQVDLSRIDKAGVSYVVVRDVMAPGAKARVRLNGMATAVRIPTT